MEDSENLSDSNDRCLICNTIVNEATKKSKLYTRLLQSHLIPRYKWTLGDNFQYCFRCQDKLRELIALKETLDFTAKNIQNNVTLIKIAMVKTKKSNNKSIDRFRKIAVRDFQPFVRVQNVETNDTKKNTVELNDKEKSAIHEKDKTNIYNLSLQDLLNMPITGASTYNSSIEPISINENVSTIPPAAFLNASTSSTLQIINVLEPTNCPTPTPTAPESLSLPGDCILDYTDNVIAPETINIIPEATYHFLDKSSMNFESCNDQESDPLNLQYNMNVEVPNDVPVPAESEPIEELNLLPNPSADNNFNNEARSAIMHYLNCNVMLSRSNRTWPQPRMNLSHLTILAIKNTKRDDMSVNVTEIILFIRDNFPFYENDKATLNRKSIMKTLNEPCFVKAPPTNKRKLVFTTIETEISSCIEFLAQLCKEDVASMAFPERLDTFVYNVLKRVHVTSLASSQGIPPKPKLTPHAISISQNYVACNSKELENAEILSWKNPTLSITELIILAITNSDDQHMYMSIPNIYNFIIENFPYYQTWKTPATLEHEISDNLRKVFLFKSKSPEWSTHRELSLFTVKEENISILRDRIAKLCHENRLAMAHPERVDIMANNALMRSAIPELPQATVVPSQKSLSFQTDGLVWEKPTLPCSYLAALAIKNSARGDFLASAKEIFDFVSDNYPYYQSTNPEMTSKFKNSISGCLAHSKDFISRILPHSNEKYFSVNDETFWTPDNYLIACCYKSVRAMAFPANLDAMIENVKAKEEPQLSCEGVIEVDTTEFESVMRKRGDWARPPLTLIQLALLAITNSPTGSLQISEIIQFIGENFPYYYSTKFWIKSLLSCLKGAFNDKRNIFQSNRVRKAGSRAAVTLWSIRKERKAKHRVQFQIQDILKMDTEALKLTMRHRENLTEMLQRLSLPNDFFQEDNNITKESDVMEIQID